MKKALKGLGMLARDAARLYGGSAREVGSWFVGDAAERDAFDARFELTRAVIARKVRRLVRPRASEEPGQ